MRFDVRDLEHFVAVAETGSIARAAERYHTVASAVSKRLSDLEESFGTPAKHPEIHVHLEQHVSTSVAAGVVDNLADFGIMSSLRRQRPALLPA